MVFAIAHGNAQAGEGEGVFVGMIQDSYGNYVIRKFRLVKYSNYKLTYVAEKLLDTLGPGDYLHFLDQLQPAMTQAEVAAASKSFRSKRRCIGSVHSLADHRTIVPSSQIFIVFRRHLQAILARLQRYHHYLRQTCRAYKARR